MKGDKPPSVRDWLEGWLRRHMPAGLFAQAQVLLFAVGVAGVVGVAVLARPLAPLGIWQLPLSLTAGVGLVAAWVRQLRRAGTSEAKVGAPMDVFEGLALAALCSGVAVPSEALGVLFPALMFRSVSGGSLRAALRGLT